MTSPNLPQQFPLPSNGGRPMTYPQLLKQISCIVPAGVHIKPSSIPSATVNLGDILADQTKILTAFTSAFSLITEIVKYIMCMMDVLCAMPNPIATVIAVARLFGKCLPEFILILPQLGIPAEILCLIKILIAVARFILETIFPIIEDIIRNVEDIKSALEDKNEDAIQAVAFKLTQLIKEIVNIFGILAVFEAIFIMIKALLGINIPCIPGSSSCSSCKKDNCPDAIKNFSTDGLDGYLTVFYENDGIDYSMIFSSVSKKDDFLQMKNFFPNVNYSLIDDPEDAAYSLEFEGSTYVVTSIENAGYLNIISVKNPTFDDGYLSSVYNSAGVITPFTDPTNQIRFGTKTKTFSNLYVNNYINLRDTNSGGSLNSGTFKIEQVFDSYNVILTKGQAFGSGSGWNTSATLDPSTSSSPGCKMIWRYVPKAPNSVNNQPFSLKVNHDELLRHSAISISCHPTVSAGAQGLKNRFPILSDLTMPVLPSYFEINSTTGNVQLYDDSIKCMGRMLPENIEDFDMDYVLNNYLEIGEDAAKLQTCIANLFGKAESDLTDLSKQTYQKLISQEKSEIYTDRVTQIVNGGIIITVKALDLYGNILSRLVPSGTINVEIYTTFGSIGVVTEQIGSNGEPTGEYTTVLSSSHPGQAQITASIDTKMISDFVDDFATTHQTPHLVDRVISVQFIDSADNRHQKVDRNEPLGVGR